MDDLAITAIAGAAAPGAMKVLHTLVRVFGIPLQKLLIGMAEARAKERLAQAGAKVKITAAEGDAQAKLVALEGERKAALALQENRIQDMTLEMDAKVRQAELELRRDERIKNLESFYQKNFESISAQAITFAAAAKPEDISSEMPDPDRIANIYERAKTCSDEQMQSLWAQILAREVVKPGSFSPQTISIVDDLSKEDAHLFTRLGSFVWSGPTIPRGRDFILINVTENDISFNDQTILESLRLIKRNFPGIDIKKHNDILLFYCDKDDEAVFCQFEGYKEVNIGELTLTRAGKELFRICGAQPNHVYKQKTLKWFQEKHTLDFYPAQATYANDPNDPGRYDVRYEKPADKAPKGPIFGGSTTA